jgi:formate hydrogenlyase transcriptional activator
LQNVIERGVILSQGGTLHIDASILGAREPRKPAAAQTDVLERNERDLIEAALTEAKGRIAGPNGAATRLGIPASTLESKIRALKIDKHRFRSPTG